MLYVNAAVSQQNKKGPACARDPFEAISGLCSFLNYRLRSTPTRIFCLLDVYGNKRTVVLVFYSVTSPSVQWTTLKNVWAFQLVPNLTWAHLALVLA